MCGIAGRANLVTGAPVDPEAVERMCELLRHRGPDGSGSLVDGAVGFAHVRLAVIDLSAAGRQPMQFANGRYWITFNGEIYNYLELREQLCAAGTRFVSRTDTEVILALYAQYGPQCVHKLRGMFAFAIWDAVERTLFIARDRLGKKPLFYREDENGLAFASEAKAFLAERSFEPAPNFRAISDYLSYQYLPAPESAFVGVKKLPPAHWLVYRNGSASIQRYWRLEYEPKQRLSESAATEALVAKLEDAVRRRLVSDVPLGAFLSGGLDSSVITAVIARIDGRALKTFSIGFPQESHNELEHARTVAQHYSTDHHEFIVEPDALEILPRLVWHYDEPFADSSAIPSFYLAQLARQHVTVAVTGDGGDESFAGYNRYVEPVRNRIYGALPLWARHHIALASRRRASGSGLPPIGDFRSWLGRMGTSARMRYVTRMMQFDAEMKAVLCTPEFLSATGYRNSSDVMAQVCSTLDEKAFLDGSLALDALTYLPGALLPKLDIATMAHGLEARSPLLDHEFMEFAATLPVAFKLHQGVRKYLFRKMAGALLPKHILDRPKKGFSVPLATWFRTQLKPLVHETLLDGRFARRGIFKPESIELMLSQHQRGIRDWQRQIWNLIMLEHWFRTFIDSTPRLRDAAGRRCVVVPQ